jgi:GR25 family glycosyltransferase involved in LPS biosynthesis
MKQKQRMDNIQEQEKKLNGPSIKIVDAVVGNNLILEKMNNYKPATKNNFQENMNNRKREVGCYMSHLKIYDIIKNKNRLEGYSVIFEDDVNINKDFTKSVDRVLYSLRNNDFDFLFLGMLNGDGGEHVVDTVYKIPNRDKMWQTHAYIV